MRRVPCSAWLEQCVLSPRASPGSRSSPRSAWPSRLGAGRRHSPPRSTARQSTGDTVDRRAARELHTDQPGAADRHSRRHRRRPRHRSVAGCTMAIDLADSPVPADAAGGGAVGDRDRRPARLPHRVRLRGGPPADVEPQHPARRADPQPRRERGSARSAGSASSPTSRPTSSSISPGGGRTDPTGSRSITPVRAYDTRELPRCRTPAGAARCAASRSPECTCRPTPRAAVVNLTVTGADSLGFLVAFPCGERGAARVEPQLPRRRGAIRGRHRRTRPRRATVRACPTSTSTSWSTSPGPTPQPRRSAPPPRSTRRSATAWSTPEFLAGRGRSPFAPDEIRRDRSRWWARRSPGRSAAVVLNVVATNATEPGWVALFPCSGAVPFVSSLNFATGGETTNLVDRRDRRHGRGLRQGVAGDRPRDRPVRRDAPARRVARGTAVVRLAAPRFPDFTPDGSDYAVDLRRRARPPSRCTSTCCPGVTREVNGVTHAPATSTSSPCLPRRCSPSTSPRQRRASTYFFRCVPPDFPPLDVDRHGTTTPGWYLTTFGFGQVPFGSFTAILDERGAPVWYKRTDVDVIDFKRLVRRTLGVHAAARQRRSGSAPTRGYRLDRSRRPLARRAPHRGPGRRSRSTITTTSSCPAARRAMLDLPAW